MFVRDAGPVAGFLVAAVVSLSGQAPPGDLARYRDTLAHLDATTPACLESARAALVAGFSPSHPDRETALREFRAFYRARYNEWEQTLIRSSGMMNLANLTWQEPAGSDTVVPQPVSAMIERTSAEARAARDKQPEDAARLDALRRWRFAVVRAEGDWYLQPDAAWLSEVAKAVPCPLADFLHFLAREARQPLAGDSSLAMSWDDLRARIARWDAFARSHQGLPETADVRGQQRQLMGLYLCPTLDNTPEYDRVSKQIHPELLASYKRFAAENKDVDGHAFVAGLLDRLMASRLTLTPSVAAYLERKDSPSPCGGLRDFRRPH